MTDRIGALGGTLGVTSEPGRGTTVHGVLPVAGPGASAGPRTHIGAAAELIA